MKQILFITGFFLLSFCGNSQTVKDYTANNAFEIIKQRDTTSSILIDGRNEDMFKSKHIFGAVNIDAFQENVENALTPLLENKQIIVYCTNYKRAELIVDILFQLKFKGEIVFINDGINGWIASGYETISTDKI
jgi:rhodanese-related sulfurtransferase